MQTAVVRVSQSTHAMLRAMSEQTGETMQCILEKAVQEYQKRLFWEQTNAAYAALRKDEKAWKEELTEREAWDATLSDGLEAETEGEACDVTLSDSLGAENGA